MGARIFPRNYPYATIVVEGTLSLLSWLLPFLLVLGVLIFVHELGHFLVARWYGVRVLTFSLGFGPKILKLRRGDTEYCVSLVPLGGYVKMAGETTQDEREGAPDEFLSKSKWVRFQVYLAGPAMNVFLAIIGMTIVLANGMDVEKYRTLPAVIGSVAENSAAARAGIQVGDRVVSINDRAVPTWDALEMAVLPKANAPLVIVVQRAGAPLTLTATPAAQTKWEFGYLGVGPLTRAQVVSVFPNTPAERAGLKRGDVLLSIDGQDVGGAKGLNREGTFAVIQKAGPRPIPLIIERNGERMELTGTPEGPVGSSKLGFQFYPFEFERIDPALPQAFAMSLRRNWEDSLRIGDTLKGLVTRETPVKQLVGPAGIAELSGRAAELGWIALLEFISMMSLNLALLNLMPVPVLDGGQITILALEGVARRDLSVRVKERIAMVGAALILALMVTVLYNDIARMLR